MTLSPLLHTWKACVWDVTERIEQTQKPPPSPAQPQTNLPEPETKKKRVRVPSWTVNFRADESDLIRTKAKEAGCTVSSYIRASTLGSTYKTPRDQVLIDALLKLNRELTAHGHHLNQIAKHLHAGSMDASQSAVHLASIRTPLIQALRALKTTLTQGTPHP